MSAFALISGTLFRAPERRTSKNSKDFTTGTLRFKDGETFQFVRFVAFSESAQADLLQLSEGDALAVTGPLKAELYTAQNGETKISLSIVADKVLQLKQPSKNGEVKPPVARSRQDVPARGGAAAFDDSIPFGCES
jgi:single-stranded DNA-binding protein